LSEGNELKVAIVDLSGLPSGIYLFTVLDSEGMNQGSQKVILR